MMICSWRDCVTHRNHLDPVDDGKEYILCHQEGQCCEQTDNPYMITGYEGRLFVYHVCIERQSKHYVWIERTSVHMDVLDRKNVCAP